MKIIGLFISLLLHAGLIFLTLSWTVAPPVKISLDMPVYKVDLVSLAPLPAAPAIKKAPSAPGKLVKPGAVALPQNKPKVGVKAKPDAPKVVKAKPKPKPKSKPKPKPKAKKISPKKVKTTKPSKKKTDDKVKKPVKKETPAKQKTAKKSPPKKAKPEKPKVSAEDALAADLAALTKMVEKKQKAEQRAVANDLAALAKTAKSTEVSGAADGTAGASGLVQVYASIVKETVRKNWRYPVFGQKSNLMAQVQIQLKSSGEISGLKLLQSSGNVDFDDSVMTAIRDTEVLPKPPGTSIRTLIVNFNLQDLDQ